jgi:hypothetical protein
MALHRTGDDVELGGDADLSLAIAQEIAGTLELDDAEIECRHIAVDDAKAARQLDRVDGNAGAGQRIENFDPRRQRG